MIINSVDAYDPLPETVYYMNILANNIYRE